MHTYVDKYTHTPIIKTPVINLSSWKCSFSYWGTSMIFIRMWFVCVCMCRWVWSVMCCVNMCILILCTWSTEQLYITALWMFWFVLSSACLYAYIPIHTYVPVSHCMCISTCVCLCVCAFPTPSPPTSLSALFSHPMPLICLINRRPASGQIN